MITLFDTNVLLDIFLPDPKWGERSLFALEMALRDGALIINEIVYAELVPQFSTKELLDTTLTTLGITIAPLGKETAYKAGMAWKEYRKAGGSRDRVLADFLIGAHALVHAQQLLTRDRGFYKKYFKSLKVIY